MLYDSSLLFVLESRNILEQWTKCCYEITFGLPLFCLVSHLTYRIINALRPVRYVLLIADFEGNIRSL
jgi:hypothetical protein